MTQQEALTLINSVFDLTNQQGQVIQTEASTLQAIKDAIDALRNNPDVPAAVADRLSQLAPAVQAVKDSLDQQAAFSAAILTPGAPIPGPVPPASTPTV